MEQAVKFIELTDAFIKVLEKVHTNVQRAEGRRFDRISYDNVVRFFIDRNSWEIFGAKSSFQYNPRRLYGTLETVDQYNWAGKIPSPLAGTDAENTFKAREDTIAKNYKPRGRPKKKVNP